jgi:thiamine-phosphate pyrophosphorylase
MSDVARMLDANANRAREALRMLEDIARFSLNHAALAHAAKQLRHDLQQALSVLPEGWLVAHRDTLGDVGTNLSTETEALRTSTYSLATAAGKRATEALRVLEETSKLVQPSPAPRFEHIRYRAYELERQLLAVLPSGRCPQWKVCLLLTTSTCMRPWKDVLTASLKAGIDCVQVREKNMLTRALIEHTTSVLDLARQHNASVIVNDRVDVALACRADGVHVGQTDMTVSQVRALAGHSLHVGVSTHGMEEAARAVADGADYCGVGAMFASPTKPGLAISGPAYLAKFVQAHPDMPHLAIGGINVDYIDQLVAHGVRGVAVGTAVCAAQDPGEIASVILSALT